MADKDPKFDEEARILLSWVQACGRHGALFTHEPETPEDLCDGQALFQILADIDGNYFRNPSSSTEPTGNWVIKLGSLKRLYKLVVQYLNEELQEDVSSLPQPDLNEIARNHNTQELCNLLRLVIAIPAKVRAAEQIDILKTLDGDLMRSIAHIMQEAVEDVSASTRRANAADDPNSSRNDGEEGNMSVEQSAEMRELKEKLKQSEEEKKKLELAYVQVLDEQRQLQSSFEDQQAERSEVEADLARVKQELQDSQNNQTEVLLRQEVERLKADLRTSEDNLTEAEDQVTKLQKSSSQMTRKIEELQKKAEEAGRLKDQVDELKHSAEKVTRLESVVDKYKKKIEEGADVRRQVKQLEEENSSLINRNTALEDEYKRVSAFKPLMDSYKSQIQDLESKASNLQRDLNTARYDSDQLKEKLMTAEETRDREKEERELLEQRLEEIELRSDAGVRAKGRISTASTNIDGDGDGDAVNGTEDAADPDVSRSFAADDLGDELEDALDGTSVTDLRIRVHKLTRELEAAKANKADVSRILVLENLLDDSLRMKGRYEADYLREYQAKLVLQNELDAVRNGKSSLGDGPEAAFALRKRLNETVDELDAVRKQLQELEVKHEAMTRELTIAKSDLTLVNKDQIDILRTLRASVEVEKQDLDKLVTKLRDELRTAEDRNTMFMAQVNGLLMEKVDLQSEGITQREEALRRERNLGELRLSLAGKALPKEAEDFIAQMQINQQATDKQLQSVQDKFDKAKALIEQQDWIIKDKERNGGGLSDEQLVKAKRLGDENNKRLRLELRLIGSAYHELGLRLSQEIRAGARSASSHRREGGLGMTPASWLLAQRRVVVPGLSYGR
ncbi:hypothetical protein A4X09_0g1297 [Tilletia walkeri]|uniref:Calponin-homology (CH) domain-containing protein n=1 Tax=Tilletia walkeri TaxID=117179 RepID=A0A8X7T6W3_9BASI|nr:hypothetical protein A4X09_0g1297 [Tilletia walkeri]